MNLKKVTLYKRIIIICWKQQGVAEESSDDEGGSESPLDEVPGGSGVGQDPNNLPGMFPPSSLSLIPNRSRHDSSTR